jgi:hypothetical protein
MLFMSEVIEIGEIFPQAQRLAADALRTGFDESLGFPVTAKGYGDFWPSGASETDTFSFVEAYAAIGEPRMASRTMGALLRSARTDGSYPHLVQGSHKRVGVETRAIDRKIYRLQGMDVGTSRLGEHVTSLYAAPIGALSALAIANYNMQDDGPRISVAPTVDALVAAKRALYDARGNDDGLIEAHHKYELTLSAGRLVGEFGRKEDDQLRYDRERAGVAQSPVGAIVDPAMNAMLVLDNAALIEYARINDKVLPSQLREQMAKSAEAVMQLTAQASAPDNIEQTIARARLGRIDEISDEMLAYAYRQPPKDASHVEDEYLPVSLGLELASNTPDRPESQEYVQRNLASIVMHGKFPHFENRFPIRGFRAPWTNKNRRLRLWLPTAKVVALLDADDFVKSAVL